MNSGLSERKTERVRKHIHSERMQNTYRYVCMQTHVHTNIYIHIHVHPSSVCRRVLVLMT